MQAPNWHRLGPVAQFTEKAIQQIKIGKLAIALTYRDGEFARYPASAIMSAAPWGTAL